MEQTAAAPAAEAPEAQAQVETPAVPQAATPADDDLTPKQRVAARMKALRASLAAKTAHIDVAQGGDAPQAESTDGETEKPETEGEPEAEKTKESAEDKDDLELEVVKAKRALANANDDLRQVRTENKALKEKVTAYEGRTAKVNADPAAALSEFKAIFGRDFGEFTEWIVTNEDKIKSTQRYADLPPDVREELELAKKERAERIEREKQAQQTKAQSEYAGKVTQYLTENAEDYPLASALDWAAGDLTATYGVGKVRPEHIEAFEKLLSENLARAISNEKVVNRLLSSDEKIATVLQAAISKQPKKSPAVASPSNGTPAPADGPRGLSNSVSPGSVVTAPDAKPDRRAMLVAEMKKMRAAQTRGV